MADGDFTPGPWEMTPNGPCFNIRSACRDDHHMIAVGMTYNEPGEHEANCRLIAAAPELLEALEWLVRAVNTGQNTLARAADAVGVILKARGED